LRLALYRVDGEVKTIDLGLSMPTRSASHVARLLDLQLERIAAPIEDAGFGFETIGLAVTTAERMEPQQTDLAAFDDADKAERCAALIDRLQQRLGPHSVQCLKPVESHLPERAETACAATGEASAWPASDNARRRPLLLLPHAEPAKEVMALIPEGPPQRFRWHGEMHEVAKAQGPERIAGEWWRTPRHQATRDYYLVEDTCGRRFWLYREGLYGRAPTAPCWYVHGLFA
jgi:protein ImuB